MKKYLTICAAFSALALPASPITRNLSFDFERSTGNWMTPGYWAGKIQFVTGNARTGKGSVKVTTTEKRGSFFARGVFFGLTHKYLAGQKISISFYARGTGNICAGALLYGRNGKGGESMNFTYGKKIQLSGQWQKIEFIADLSETFADRIAPIFELHGLYRKITGIGINIFCLNFDIP